MPERFAFRQIHYSDLETLLNDGEIRAHQHEKPQKLHQASRKGLVGLRDDLTVDLCGTTVNQCVAFYFTPFTAYSHNIATKNVPMFNETGSPHRPENRVDRVFLTVRVSDILARYPKSWITDRAANTEWFHASSDPATLESHVKWEEIDGDSFGAIPELGYLGGRRKPNTGKRSYAECKSLMMAELLVAREVSFDLVAAIICPNEYCTDLAFAYTAETACQIPILTKPECFFYVPPESPLPEIGIGHRDSLSGNVRKDTDLERLARSKVHSKYCELSGFHGQRDRT